MWACFLTLVWLDSTSDQALQSALAKEQAGDDAGAVASLTTLSRANPIWDLPHLELARLALKEGGNMDAALLHLEVAESVAPENPRGQYLFGLWYEERGKTLKARAAFERAVLFRPNYPEARFRLGGLYLAADEPDSAVAQFSAIKRLDPTATQARLQLAQAEEKQGNPSAAESELKSLHAEQPESKAVTRRLAELYERTLRPKLAQRLRAELAPASPRHLRALPRSRR